MTTRGTATFPRLSFCVGNLAVLHRENAPDTAPLHNEQLSNLQFDFNLTGRLVSGQGGRRLTSAGRSRRIGGM